MKTWWIAFAMGATWLLSSAACAQTDAPAYADEGTEPMWMLVGIGAGLFVGEYVGELAIGAITGASAEELERAAIPLAGPWLELTSGDDREWWEVVMTVGGGVMQVAGLALVAIGLAWQRPTGRRAGEQVALHPITLRGGAGIGVSGGFL